MKNVGVVRPRRLARASGVPGTVPGTGDGSKGLATTWRQLVWEKWRWGVLIVAAVILSRITTSI